MKTIIYNLFIFTLILFFSGFSFAQVNVSTYAGALNIQGSMDGNLTTARFGGPAYIAFDQAGNMFISDAPNNTIRKIDTQGNVTTYAGATTSGYVNGTLANARFHGPIGLAFDTIGNLYVGDSGNNCIRKIDTNGNVTTFAGSQVSDFIDSPNPLNARFRNPNGICFDNNGDMLVADPFNHAIRKITLAGVVTTVAGTGVSGHLNGPAASALFQVPIDVKVDAQNNIYVTEPQVGTVRKISNGTVSNFAGTNTTGYIDGIGTAARFNQPYFLAMHKNGNLFVSDQQNWVIRAISPAGNVQTLAGTGAYGTNNGSGTVATFTNASGMAIGPDGALYITDYNARAIRKIMIPNPTATTPAFVCKGNSATLNASGSAPQYKWYNDQSSATALSGNATFTTAPIDSLSTYYLTSFYKGLESSRIPATLIPEIMIASFTADPKSCLGSTVNFNNTTAGAGNYSFAWDFGNGNSAISTNASEIYNLAGNYNVKLTGTTQNGCVDEFVLPIEVVNNPVANYTFSEVCEGIQTSFQNVSSGNGPLSFSWLFGDGSTSAMETPHHPYGSAGIFEAKLIVISIDGCIDSIQKMVEVFDNPMVDFTFSDDVCKCDNVTFTNTSSIASNEMLNFQWETPGLSAPDMNTNFSYSFCDEGQNPVKLTAISTKGCIAEETKNLNVLIQPDAGFTSQVIDYGKIEFTPNDMAASSYNWDFGDGNTSIIQQPEHTYASNGTYIVTLSITNINECMEVETQEIVVLEVSVGTHIAQQQLKVYPNPYRNFTNIDLSIIEAQTVKLEVYSIDGKSVVVLADEKLFPGDYKFYFSAKERGFQPGIYFIRLLSEGQTSNFKIVELD
ncbi:MAG: PKD domain-containing protein [Bacteroidetes bacterium]|nr:PKD domain-containing protein [Bacteroidota bacterium]